MFLSGTALFTKSEFILSWTYSNCHCSPDLRLMCSAVRFHILSWVMVFVCFFLAHRWWFYMGDWKSGLVDQRHPGFLSQAVHTLCLQVSTEEGWFQLLTQPQRGGEYARCGDVRSFNLPRQVAIDRLRRVLGPPKKEKKGKNGWKSFTHQELLLLYIFWVSFHPSHLPVSSNNETITLYIHIIDLHLPLASLAG